MLKKYIHIIVEMSGTTPKSCEMKKTMQVHDVLTDQGKIQNITMQAIKIYVNIKVKQ